MGFFVSGPCPLSLTVSPNPHKGDYIWGRSGGRAGSFTPWPPLRKETGRPTGPPLTNKTKNPEPKTRF